MRSAFVGLDVTEAMPYVSAAIGQLSMCALASWTPARRAAGANPLEVLRAE